MSIRTFTSAAFALFLTTGATFANPSALRQLAGTAQFDAVTVPAAKQAKWTIMVYVNSKNNLEEFGLKDMNEMEMVGSTGKVNVVTEVGRIKGYTAADGDWTGSRRYLVKKDSDFSKITSPVLQTLPKADMGDYRHLIEFGNWAKENFPADNYMLIVWNHGDGWYKGLKTKGISFDDETNNHISTPQLAQALKAIGGVQIYGSDACLMQMASVVYEIKDYAKYVLGSEELEPGDGTTYDTLLKGINESDLTPLAVGKAAVKAYADHYKQLGEGSTQSLVKSGAMPGFTQALNAFASALMASGEKTAIKTARANTFAFDTDANKDLGSFLTNVLATVNNAEVKKTAEALNTYLNKNLVAINRTSNGSTSWDNKNYAEAKGLAIYLPNTGYNTDYNELQFAAATNWPQFIKWLNSKDEVAAKN